MQRYCDLSYASDVGSIQPSFNSRGMHLTAHGHSGDGIQKAMRASNQFRILRMRISPPTHVSAIAPQMLIRSRKTVLCRRAIGAADAPRTLRCTVDLKAGKFERCIAIEPME